MLSVTTQGVRRRDFTIQVLGRTLAHLGNQLYKRRDLALVELIANCWDAGASKVSMTLPNPQGYDQHAGMYVIEDDGVGMTDDEVQDSYLVVGRNRRLTDGLLRGDRLIMGRKGVGKLAGFGIADHIAVETWRAGYLTRFRMNLSDLRAADGVAIAVPIHGEISALPDDVATPHGTRIVLQRLKHKHPLDADSLGTAIGRRFSRTVRGKMSISVNGEAVKSPTLDLVYREPADPTEEFQTIMLVDGAEIRYTCGYTETSITPVEMRGFAVYVHEKTAQAPPFFFGVEKTASGQHGTRYVWGEVHADFLDNDADDETDVVSTDRQEIDWESDSALALKSWGDELSRRLLIHWASRKATLIEDRVAADSNLAARIGRLDKASQQQLHRIIKQLARSDVDADQSMPLVDSLIRSFEYQHFHDLISEIEVAADTDPEQLRLLLERLQDWKVLESRAILEIVRGRLSIIEKFHQMIVNDAAETAGRVGDDNMHDLIAGYPWLLHPDWQVLAEEKTISRQLEEWKVEEIDQEDERLRYDFLALADDGKIVIIEIKRSNHAVGFDELQRLERYKYQLLKAHSKTLYMVMIGSSFAVDEATLDTWEKREDGELRKWSDIYTKTRSYYEHYRAVLEGDVTNPHFLRKVSEVASTRSVLERGSVYRGPAERRVGLGPQDQTWETPSPKPTT